MSKTHILLVEDDESLGLVTRDSLRLQGYQVTHCLKGNTAWEIFQTKSFDICLLDIMLPQLDGFSLAEKIRTQNVEIPIIFLTAKSLNEDKIKGLKLGADDYITKPFSMEELILKIEIFLKRSKILVEAESSHFTFDQFNFDFQNLTLNHPQKKQKLTMREAEVLQFFCQNQHRVIKREEILTAIWGEDDYFKGRSLDVFITRLRKYLKIGQNVTIENIPSVGFRFLIQEN